MIYQKNHTLKKIFKTKTGQGLSPNSWYNVLNFKMVRLSIFYKIMKLNLQKTNMPFTMVINRPASIYWREGKHPPTHLIKQDTMINKTNIKLFYNVWILPNTIF